MNVPSVTAVPPTPALRPQDKAAPDPSWKRGQVFDRRWREFDRAVRSQDWYSRQAKLPIADKDERLRSPDEEIVRYLSGMYDHSACSGPRCGWCLRFRAISNLCKAVTDQATFKLILGWITDPEYA